MKQGHHSNYAGAPRVAIPTPRQRGRRVTLILWGSALILLGAAWMFGLLLIDRVSDSAVRSTQNAELQIARSLAGSLEQCVAAGEIPATATDQQDSDALLRACLTSISKLSEMSVWAIALDALADGRPLTPGAALNASLVPQQILRDLVANADTTAAPGSYNIEGTGRYTIGPQMTTQVGAWTAANISPTPWVVGVSTPQDVLLSTTGIMGQQALMLVLMGVATLVWLLLTALTATSIRRQHAAEQGLVAANVDLETRVAERTAELLATNREMQQEIERRLKAEEALQASEARSRSLLNALPDLMFVLDRDGNYLEVRGAPDAAYYHAAMNVVGMNISKRGPIADDLPHVQTAIATALYSGITQEITYHTDDPNAGLNTWTARLAPINSREVLMLARNITSYSQAIEMIERVNEEVLDAYDATLLGWSRMLEVRENETAGHSQRVAELTVRLARAVGCSEPEITQVRRGALLHDIGKMALPDAILRKAGALSEDERMQVQRHPELAYIMLSDIEFLRPALDIPYCHHERWNGSGYPRGLCGEDIPLAARIFSVVDVWDALLADRPYKARWTPGAASAYLREHSGTLFDPHIVTVFIDMIGEDAT